MSRATCDPWPQPPEPPGTLCQGGLRQPGLKPDPVLRTPKDATRPAVLNSRFQAQKPLLSASPPSHQHARARARRTTPAAGAGPGRGGQNKAAPASTTGPRPCTARQHTPVSGGLLSVHQAAGPTTRAPGGSRYEPCNMLASGPLKPRGRLPRTARCRGLQSAQPVVDSGSCCPVRCSNTSNLLSQITRPRGSIACPSLTGPAEASTESVTSQVKA